MALSLIFFFILFSKIVEAQEDVRIELMLPFDGLTCSTECYVPIDTSTKFLKLRAFSSVELINPSLAHMQSPNNNIFFSVISFPY